MMPCASSPCMNLTMYCTQSNSNMGLIRVCTTDLVNVSMANQRPGRSTWLLVNKSMQLRMMPLCYIDAMGPGQRSETAPPSSPRESTAGRKLPENS